MVYVSQMAWAGRMWYIKKEMQLDLWTDPKVGMFITW